ncbi:MAG: hypothetical protein PF961_07295 [Planctomycetota bacterium]|jgi:hypothetical protein|nr:hypothetical protein [Planctomycetota bacterium]
MVDRSIVALRPFVPSGADFEGARDLFIALGFEQLWAVDDYVGLRNGRADIILQRYDEPGFAENLMFRLDVADLDAWWAAFKDLPERFPGCRIKGPTDYPWGREVHLIDLAGVCWHIGVAED